MKARSATLGAKHPGDPEGDGTVVGDAHDQAALTGHERIGTGHGPLTMQTGNPKRRRILHQTTEAFQSRAQPGAGGASPVPPVDVGSAKAAKVGYTVGRMKWRRASPCGTRAGHRHEPRSGRPVALHRGALPPRSLLAGGGGADFTSLLALVPLMAIVFASLAAFTVFGDVSRGASGLHLSKASSRMSATWCPRTCPGSPKTPTG